MIPQIALGILLAAAVLFGLFMFPALTVPALLFWLILRWCARPRADGTRMSNGAISALFAVATIVLLFALVLLSRPSRTPAPPKQAPDFSAVSAR